MSNLDEIFLAACSEGDLETIQPLRPYVRLEQGFINACIGGHLNVVKYLNNSGIDIKKASDNGALKFSCYKEHLTIVKYLLEQLDYLVKDNTQRSLPHCGVNNISYPDKAFVYACEEYKENLVIYFLYEKNITISSNLLDHIKFNTNKQKFNDIHKLIQKRDLYMKLNCELKLTSEENILIKI